MKTLYRCEVCGQTRESEVLTRACEALGVIDPATYPPVGLLIGDRCGPGPACENNCRSHLCGRGFIYVVTAVEPDSFWKHGVRVYVGIFRGNGCGDTYTPGGHGYDNIAYFGPNQYQPPSRMEDWPEARDCPAYQRAILACKEAGLKPLVIRNGEQMEIGQ